MVVPSDSVAVLGVPSDSVAVFGVPSDSVAVFGGFLDFTRDSSSDISIIAWCWGLVLGSGVGVWCWGLVLGSGVGVWCWGLVCCDCMRLDSFLDQYGWQARKMPWE